MMMENRTTIYIHLLLAAVAALVLYICQKPLLMIDSQMLVFDAIISGVALSILIFLLNNIITYSSFSSLHLGQQLINIMALAVLFVLCWVGLEYILIYLFFPEGMWDVLTVVLPFKIVVAVLVYGIVVLARRRKESEEDEDIITEIEDVDAEIPVSVLETDDSNETEPVEYLERIAVKNGQRIEVIVVDEIFCLQAEGDYVMIHSQKGKFLKEQTMKSFEAGLPTDKFVRVHRSSIVNVDYIAQIELYDKQSQLLKLKNGMQVKTSIAGYKVLRKTLGL